MVDSLSPTSATNFCSGAIGRDAQWGLAHVQAFTPPCDGASSACCCLRLRCLSLPAQRLRSRFPRGHAG